jgi:hypothetical protein
MPPSKSISPRLAVVVLVLWSCAIQTARSQEATAKNPIRDALPGMCTQALDQALKQPDIAAATEREPVSNEMVCGCVETKMKKDKHLSGLFAEDLSSMRVLMQTPTFKKYFMGKMLSYIMGCAAIEIEKSTDALAP